MKCSVFIAPHLRIYSPEIEYVFSIISERINIDFTILHKTSPRDPTISYGDSSGKIKIEESFFSDYVKISEKGVTLKEKQFSITTPQKHFFKNFSVSPLFTSSKQDQQDQDHINFDLIGNIFFYLSRIEELNRTDLDKHERFKLQNTLAFKANLHKRPEAEYLILYLSNKLEKNGFSPKLDTDVKIIPTHDVDRLRSYHTIYQLIREEAGAIYHKRTSPQTGIKKIFSSLADQEPFTSFKYLIEQSEMRNLQSKFFLLCPSKDSHDANYMNDFKKDLREVVDLVKTKGHQIGLHGGYNTFKDSILFKQQKSRVEKLISVKVVENRQHVLRWNPHTPDIHESTGIEIDYSLAFPNGINFRTGTTHPFNAYSLRHRKKLNLKIIQTPIMEFALFMDKYVDLSREEAFSEIRKCAQHYKEVGGSLPLLFHTVTVIPMKDEYEKTLDLILNLTKK